MKRSTKLTFLCALYNITIIYLFSFLVQFLSLYVIYSTCIKGAAIVKTPYFQSSVDLFAENEYFRVIEDIGSQSCYGPNDCAEKSCLISQASFNGTETRFVCLDFKNEKLDCIQPTYGTMWDVFQKDNNLMAILNLVYFAFVGCLLNVTILWGFEFYLWLKTCRRDKLFFEDIRLLNSYGYVNNEKTVVWKKLIPLVVGWTFLTVLGILTRAPTVLLYQRCGAYLTVEQTARHEMYPQFIQQYETFEQQWALGIFITEGLFSLVMIWLKLIVNAE